MQADLLISLRMSLTVSLLVLLFISGVVAQDGWGVDYKDKSICALKGSTVTIRCTYTYPRGRVVLRAFWTKQWGRGSEPPDLLDDPEYRGRVQYLGDKQHNCTLRLRNVRETDQSKYYFRFLTNQTGGKYQGAGGVDLSVTDLQVEVPERVIEGDEVTLTCKTSFSLYDRPTFTWYRNWNPLSSNTDQLHLQPVSREDAGRYRCAVLDQNLHSPVVTLNVRYGPKSVSVSVSPTGEILEGRSVTLACISHANPAVQNYIWFKGTSIVAEGETYTMKKISSVDSGEYKCRSSNEHGEKLSAALTLNVLYLRVEVPERVIEGDEVTLTCKTSFSLSYRPTFTWYRNGHRLSFRTDQLHLQSVSREDAGSYDCAVWSKNLRSPEVTLNVRLMQHLIQIRPIRTMFIMPVLYPVNPETPGMPRALQGQLLPLGLMRRFSTPASSTAVIK
ncbi:B-cell receptor CD22-like [Pygocentrus nattereri]|uniref:B-cell receptor CD22-like n=1 Tax=Pygocentrus nattereri TaxID=42514 RepID=UPI00189149AE|nr:B-cell receptor CD22-like [Pygocentrus nattereri]